MKTHALFKGILTIVLVIGLGLTGCVSTSTTTITHTQVITTITTAVAIPPEYHTLNFTLDENNKDYAFHIYLGNDQTLHFLLYTGNTNNEVWTHFLTPSGKGLGSYGLQADNPGAFANGTLQEGFTQGFSTFRTIFKPADYGWGEGYYRIDCQNDNGTVMDVTVEYWIEQ